VRTVRQQFIDRSLIRTLRDCGGYLLPRQALRDTLDITCQPTPRDDEFNDALNHASANHRIATANTETGPKYKLTEVGQLWADEHHV
jgi:hypothetical protein